MFFFLDSGDPGKCDYFGNTTLHWAAVNGHFNCVSFLVSFGVSLWSLDNQYHTAKEVAAVNNREDIVQFLDVVTAKQSALNTKVVQKLKEKALNEAEKRIKLFQKMQIKTSRLAEREEKRQEKNRKKSLCMLNPESVYSDLNFTEAHIYDLPACTINGTKSLANSYHSTISSNSSMKFSDLVNSSVKSSKTGTGRMKILSGVSRKVHIRKQNSTDTMKSADTVETGTRICPLVGIKRDDQIMYVPKYGSLSVTNLTAVKDDEDSIESRKHSFNGRLHLKDVFNVNNSNRTEPKTNTFNKNGKTSLKSKLLKFNNKNGSHKCMSNGSLYRTISEPDFLSIEPNTDSERHDMKPTLMLESSSIFERPGFGSVSFRGKFTPESLFFMPRYYHPDSAGNSEDDADSGHDHSQGGSNSSSIIPKYLSNKNMCPDRESFASDSIGSAGSLVQPEYGELSESKSIPVLLFLYAHGLKEYYELFEVEKIDIDALMLLTENDLISLGIPLGPRRKLINAIHQRQLLLDTNGHVFETKL